jgi:Ricin-type beta-trefoil lectin domain
MPGRRTLMRLLVTAAAAVFPLALSQPGHAASNHYVIAVQDDSHHFWCVQSDPGGGGGVQLTLTQCANVAAQLWVPIRGINNQYILENIGGNHGCLEANANANFAPVETFTCTGVSNQNWFPSGGFFPFRQNTLIAAVAGGHRCLDIQNGAIGEGGKVDIYNCLNDDLAQQFTIDTFDNVIG